MSNRAAALAAGAVVAGLVTAASALAWRDDSPLVPRDGGLADGGTAWVFLGLLVAALASYLVGLWLLRRTAVPLRLVVGIAVAVQLVPLAAPLLLSTDAWTYWGYGWIGAETAGNPYVEPPLAYPESPALAYLGADWRDTTSVYGPVFTLLSEPVAEVAGSSEDAAAWLFKCLAAAGMLAAIAAVSSTCGRAALATAFVGWNPVVAIHAAGGGHNDALVGGLVAGGVALAAHRRSGASGVVWTLAAFVKWVPVLLFAVAAVTARARGRPTGVAAAIATVVFAGAVATWAFGPDWLGALGPLVDNVDRETSYAIPSRLEQLGVPETVALALALGVLVAGLAWIARDAARGLSRLGRTSCLLLVTTPYLAVWYLAWAVPLAALDEDDAPARVGVLALTAYLLPQTIPI